MLKARVIPCLLLRDGGLTKTEKFKKGKYIGDPINAVRIYNEKEVDELIFLDIDASKKKTAPDYNMIADLASECFMPFAYGGGISKLSEIENILKIGVEKVVLNHSGLLAPDFITQAGRQFGSSTIIVGVDIKKTFLGRYQVYDHVRDRTTGQSPVEYVRQMEEHGAGEIFINNVDKDGTYQGYDYQLIKELTSVLTVPAIVCGGAANIGDFAAAVNAGASAVAAGSMFVYQGPHKAVLINYPERKILEDQLK